MPVFFYYRPAKEEASGKTPSQKAAQLFDGWYNDAIFQRYPKMVDLFTKGKLRDEILKTNNIPSPEAVVKRFEEADKFRETIDKDLLLGKPCF